MAQVSDSGNSAARRRQTEPEGTPATIARRQAGFPGHVVRERSIAGQLPNRRLYSGRTHGARADQYRNPAARRTSLHRLVEGANERTPGKRRPRRSAHILQASKLSACMDIAPISEDRTDAEHDGGPARVQRQLQASRMPRARPSFTGVTEIYEPEAESTSAK